MSTQTYTVAAHSTCDLTFEADLAQASAPIVLVDDYGERHTTPFQTADATHDATEAAHLINSWLHSEGQEAFDLGADISVKVDDEEDDEAEDENTSWHGYKDLG